MSEHSVWPSDAARAESDELNRVCEHAEQLHDEVQAARVQGAEPVAYTNDRQLKFPVNGWGMMWPERSLLADVPIYAREQSATPEGWKLVPVEPTPEMQATGGGSIRFDTTALNKLRSARAAYRAMVDAAPQPPQEGE